MGIPIHRLLGASALLAMLPWAASAQVDDPALMTAELMPRVERSLLLSAVDSGEGLVVVGERGHVLRSGDGTHWRQVDGVPTRSTLTAVAAVGGSLWAVGHDGVILHSADGGLSWERQRADPRHADSADPDQGRPLLDVLFRDELRGIAVGAYALYLETVDGGQTWTERDLGGGVAGAGDDALEATADDDAGEGDEWLFSDEDLALEAEENPHLNAIARTPGGRIMIAGERGAAYRSFDDGETWERLALPYEGSMFGVLGWGEDRVLIFGLRGNVLESFDFGTTWQAVDSGVESSLMGGRALEDGGAVLVGAEGRVVRRDSAGQPFRVQTYVNEDGETPILADVLPLADGAFLVIGERGIGRFPPQ